MFAGQSDLDRLLSETRRLLDSVRSGQPSEASPEPVTGAGESANGRVRAVAARGGRLERVELDPRVMRMASEELAAHLVTAVNAALDQVATAAAAQAGPVAAVDTAALAEQLRQVQEDGVRRMAAFTQGISEAMAQLGRQG